MTTTDDQLTRLLHLAASGDKDARHAAARELVRHEYGTMNEHERALREAARVIPLDASQWTYVSSVVTLRAWVGASCYVDLSLDPFQIRITFTGRNAHGNQIHGPGRAVAGSSFSDLNGALRAVEREILEGILSVQGTSNQQPMERIANAFWILNHGMPPTPHELELITNPEHLRRQFRRPPRPGDPITAEDMMQQFSPRRGRP